MHATDPMSFVDVDKRARSARTCRPGATPLRTLAMLLAVSGLAVICAACTADNPAFDEPTRCGGDESLFLQSFQGVHPERVDVIILVDDTANAEVMRDALTASAAAIVDTLSGLDYRVGVLAAGGNGRLRGDEACGLGVPWVLPGTDAASELSCLLDVPTSSNVPEGLEALARAIGETCDDQGVCNPTNPGFLRADARLLVIAVSTVDDCSNRNELPRDAALEQCEWSRSSLTAVDDLFQVLRETRQDRNALAFAAIVGPEDGIRFEQGEPVEPACSGNLGAASHGLRYREVAALAAPWSATESICLPALDEAISEAIAPLLVAPESRYCLGRASSGEIRAVEVVESETTVETLEAGETPGFAFFGGTEGCENGAVVVDREARASFTAETQLDVLFCGPP